VLRAFSGALGMERCRFLLLRTAGGYTRIEVNLAFAEGRCAQVSPRAALTSSSFFSAPPGLIHVTSASASISPSEYAAWVAELAGGVPVKVASLFGRPTTDTSFAIGLSRADLTSWDHRLREALLRVRVHVEASLRLRLVTPECAVARIFPSGEFELLESGSIWLPRPTNLVRRVRVIERARHPEVRNLMGLRAWPALVDGCHSLVEREHRGRRVYVALLNPPGKAAAATLNDRESGIVELASQGLSNRHVAYALGLTGSQVSHALALVARRMKLDSRAELARHVASQTERRQSGQNHPLTAAERGVLVLVQRGLSNEAIAKLRNSSPRTVANQVASLLRKLGASNRRALAVLDHAFLH